MHRSFMQLTRTCNGTTEANTQMRTGPNWGAATLLIAGVAGGYFLWTKKGSKDGTCYL